MLQIVQKAKKCKKTKMGIFNPKSPNVRLLRYKNWEFQKNAKICPKTLRNALIFENVICGILSQSMSRHLLSFLLYVMSCCIFGQSKHE